MSNRCLVAVTSRSFSKNPVLREELLQRYPNTRFNDEGKSLAGDELVAFLQGAEKAITALEKIDESVISKLPDLKALGKYGVGTDMIDMQALRKHGVRFGWKGGVNRRSVSELTLTFMISLLRHIPYAHDEVRAGRWRQIVGRELSGRTVGIIGCGHVGKDVAQLVKVFGCPVLSHDIRDFPEFYRTHDIQPVDLGTLLRQVDVVTLHVPLDDSTRGMIGAAELACMKPEAILINAARGGIVDELALKDCLKHQRIAGAALDVLAVEPPQDEELFALPNLLLTPHIGGSSEEAVLAMGRAAIAGLDENAIPAEI